MTSAVTISVVCEAVINDDVEKIYSLYSDDEVWEKFNPSQPYRFNNTSVILLHLACSHSRYEIANYFISSEFCDVNCCDSKHRNCLHKLAIPHSLCHGYSTQDERVKIAKALLDRKCNINAQDIEGNTPVHRAIYNQDLAMLRILLEKENDIKQVVNFDGDTPLHIACTAGLSRFIRNELITRLIEVYPLSLEVCNKMGYSPLFAACTSNHSFYLEKLASALGGNLQQRAKVNQFTLLHLAVHADKLCIVEWLMKQGNKQWFQYCINSDGKTPIHLARSKECLVPLLSSGYDINIADSYGNTLLHLLAANSNHASSSFKQIDLLKYLLFLDSCDVNQRNEKLDTPLHLAVQCGDSVIVELFLSSPRCDVAARNSKGQTILHLAVNFKNKELVEIILSQACVDVDSTDNNQSTAVHLAASSAGPDILSCFKHYTGSFDAKGCNPFHVAVCKRELDIIRHIVSFADPDLSIPTSCKQGDTVLHLAAKHSSLQVLDYLLSLKSLGVNATNEDLDTCLHVAVKSSKLKIIDFLLGYEGCNINLVNVYGLSPLSMAAHSRNLEVLQMTLSRINAQYCSPFCTRQNDTPLHLAAQCNSISMLQYCLSLGFDVNSVNNNLETPLFIAVKYCNVETVQYLGRLGGCKLNIRNKDGNSPLHAAVLSNHFESVKALLSLQCDVSLRNHDGLTPLHIAVKNERSDEMLSCLVKSSSDSLLLETRDGDNVLHLAAALKESSTLLHCISCNPCKFLINSRNHADQYPLHIAVASSNMPFIKHALSLPFLKNDPLSSSNLTSLHLAIKLGNITVVMAFIEATKKGNMSLTQTYALHCAASEGRLKIFEYLLGQKLFDINSKDLHGQTPLHIAICKGFFLIAEIIIGTKQCNLEATDDNGNTPLHLICMMKEAQDESVKICKMLLRKCKVSCIYITNNDGKTPAELAKDNYKLLHELHDVAKVAAHNPLENVMKVVVIGKSGVGKSSLIEAITAESKPKLWTKKQLVKNVSTQTTGIERRPFLSRKFGHVTFYEFAGQLEQYSSNAAILENLISHSPPIFVVVVSLKNSDDEILSDLSYWWHFIDTSCQKSSGGTSPLPHTILALSHFDFFKSQGRVNRIWLQEQIGELPVRNFKFCQRISFLDCRKLSSRGLTGLQTHLSNSCSALRVNIDVDLACHYLIAFITEHFGEKIAIQLIDIQRQVKEDSFIQCDSEELLKLLETLHHQDKVLLLKNSAKVEDSWIVLQKDTLLSKVNGSIFSPKKFQKHLECSTGVVPFEKIKLYFEGYDPFMLIGFFQHLEFCSLIEDQKAYSLIQNDHPTLAHQKYYFFPGLIRAAYPFVSEVWKNPLPKDHVKYGWFYEADQYELQPRFLHVLILRIVFQFALEGLNVVDTPVLNRRCTVWKNGVAWLKDGLQVVVEVGLQKNWVSAIIQCENTPNVRVQCSRVLVDLTQVIRDTRKEFCPSSSMLEYFIAPEHVDYPMEAKLAEGQACVLYEAGDAARRIQGSCTTGHVTDKSGHFTMQLEHLVPFEPLIYCGKMLISDIL